MFLVALITACLILLAQPVMAQSGDDQKVLYQTSFDTDPQWTTNSPSSDYWDPSLAMYHFKIEPASGGYAYKKDLNYDRGPFTLEYDVIIESIDDSATFRLGFSNYELDINKGPNVVTEFTNAKYGKIMWLHLVTPGNKVVDINSQHLPTELGLDAYAGPTVNYALNKTYHVTVNYDDSSKILGMRVSDKITGKEIWSYYMNTWENLHGMDRIYIGAVGDYGNGAQNLYAQGYIDNIKLTVPSAAPAQTTATPFTTAPTYSVNPSKTTPRTTISIPTTYPIETQKSPVSLIPVLGALGIVSVGLGLRAIKKKK